MLDLPAAEASALPPENESQIKIKKNGSSFRFQPWRVSAAEDVPHFEFCIDSGTISFCYSAV